MSPNMIITTGININSQFAGVPLSGIVGEEGFGVYDINGISLGFGLMFN